MKAMIFAAGMGTRLQPLTFSKPKALVEVKGVPMLEIVIKRLIKYGFTDIVINVHHFAEQIISFLEKNRNFGVTINISDETDLLLDTGGGLLRAQSLLSDGEPFLVHNVDILTDFDLTELYNFHLQHRPLATLAVKSRNTSRSLLVNDKGELSGWKNNQTGKTIISKGEEKDLQPIAFSGVHVLSPDIFSLITETGVFSIMDSYLRLARENKIMTWRHDQNFWLDLGRVENLAEAEPYVEKVW
ncbi:MAG: sugar phosphate nucleotidyltransferase [Bacteroidota bacterium]|nr:sugar phosphate nucleotidyltransferase [Bacteroidota bacterium]